MIKSTIIIINKMLIALCDTGTFKIKRTNITSANPSNKIDKMLIVFNLDFKGITFTYKTKRYEILTQVFRNMSCFYCFNLVGYFL